MVTQFNTLKSYIFPIILLLSILLGGLTGYVFNQNVAWLKPFGDIFLNLIFTTIVPLIFFSVSSAIARTGSIGKLGKIFYSMTVIFLFTGIVAAVYALFVVLLFPPAQNMPVLLESSKQLSPTNLPDRLIEIFTVPEFSKLFSHEHILALVLFSILVGLAVAHSKDKGTIFNSFLKAGEDVFMSVFRLIMYYAPIGFFAYFAVIVSEIGPQLMENYLRIAILYYTASVFYFFFALTAYAYLAGKSQGVRLFWGNIFLPAATSIATCSSAASIPANLMATKSMRIPAEIYETSIPLGSIIHKDGSVMGGVFKIAFLFGIFHLPFASLPVLMMALGVSLLVGTVMGAIPSGGMLGELLILSVYGFPPSVLIAVAAISIIIDPIATMVNVTSNSVCSMMIARLVEGKNWFLRSSDENNL
ncbi:Glutamate-aspartate carrier protein [Legionella pneumophila]|uniref:Sodium:dicarboxylate symporter n=1 Tax=Legionella pneumophila subsp. pneumophila TaxID=91891 RepID=A0AAV2UUM2_LEGPN|nr:dicarboxylate/amino acid:cation symporter [Legionella pneumophila]AMV13474.1 Proton/sodium-glutamate symport protein [Legionella pneumophila]ANN91792.1 sodium:proton antiporter [Legionella pneumophila]MCZ4678449.1 dicarboxylate/amino acid:cation symporter [Legionella pneumophila]MCZ4703802.1 dicarboxylate/amino acid:cation symporter [Legionella pneumophila]MCZ4750223.1 dicarboxylate/amino acid:cation symporter [Legionella pneumophila]